VLRNAKRFIPATVVFHAKRDRAKNANAHLAHLQALTHRLMLQLANEPDFSRRSDGIRIQIFKLRFVEKFLYAKT
jgi:hypothetical protein